MQVPFDTVVLPSYRVTHATVMSNLHPNLKVILIGGSSQAGKSTLSESLAATFGHVSPPTAWHVTPACPGGQHPRKCQSTSPNTTSAYQSTT